MRTVVPDVVGDDVRLVLCGLTSQTHPRDTEHHHDGVGNMLWDGLADTGLTPRRLRPDEEDELPRHGIALTDLVRPDRQTPWDDAVDALAVRLGRWHAPLVALTSKTAGAVVARVLGERAPSLGPVDWALGGADVFVLPGPSGANRRRDYDGLPDRLTWWHRLREMVDG